MMKFDTATLYHLPPGSLLLERNIRDSKPTPELVKSIAEIGVLEPITAVLNADGGLMVRFGQRRTLAALEAGRETVPVYVSGTDDTSVAAEVDRIIAQHDENTHRAGLTTAEEVGVVAQLTAFGLSAEQISKQARIHKDRVATAVKVAGSKMATKSAAKWDELSLDQVAVIAEFEDDADAVKSLVQSARDGRFEHTAQRMRDDRERAVAKAACIAGIIAEGITPLDKKPDYSDKAKPIDRLVDATTGKQVTKATHAKCPGNVAYPEFMGYRAEPMFVAELACKDPKKHGHRDTWSSGSGSRTPTAELSEAREEARAARKLVIENNKAWDSAMVVRREFITTAITKLNTAPKGAAAFIAVAITKDAGQMVNDWKSEPAKLTRTWLGIKDNGYGLNLESHVKGKPDSRALVLALVHVLAIYETQAMDKMAWRRDGTDSSAGRYLRFLETAGYILSDVEKFAASKKTIR